MENVNGHAATESVSGKQNIDQCMQLLVTSYWGFR